MLNNGHRCSFAKGGSLCHSYINGFRSIVQCGNTVITTVAEQAELGSVRLSTILKLIDL